MICLRCRDQHAGNDLSLADSGVSLTLGDCPKSGSRHEWRPGRFVIDAPLVVCPGQFRVLSVAVPEARAFVRGPLVMSCLRTSFVSLWLSDLLGVPLIHHDNPKLRVDVGDRVLAPIIKNRFEYARADAMALDRDYELLLIERTA
jgi:hypothetical protein